jgi:hypothetical protein
MPPTADDAIVQGQQDTGAAPTTPQQSDQTKPDAQASRADGSQAQGDQQRDGWVPSYRLRDVSQRAERAEQTLRELQQKLEEQDRRFKTAFGIDEPDPHTQKVREDFYRLFPEYRRLEKLAARADDIEEILGLDLKDFKTQVNTGAGHFMLDILDKSMSDAYGEKVPELAKQAAYSTFIAWVGADEAAQARYGRRDPSLPVDFWKLYSSGVLEPHRTHFSEAEARRRAAAHNTVRGGGTGIIQQKERPKIKPGDLDAAADVAFGMLDEQRNAGR